MNLYTEEQLNKILFYISPKNENYNKIKEVLDVLKPIEVADGLKTFKKIIEDRPTEFSQYNAYTLLYVIDLIQNGQEVPEQMELIKMIKQNK